MAEYVSLVKIVGQVDPSLNRAVKSTRTKLSGIQTPLNALSSFAVRDVESAIDNLGQKGQQAAQSLAGMIPKFKGLALGAGVAVGAIAGVTTGMAKLGAEAHRTQDAVTLSDIDTTEFQQLTYLFQGFGNEGEKVANQMTMATSSISRDLQNVFTQGEAIAKLTRGFQGTGFDIDIFRTNNPLAVLEETQKALAAGADETQIRIGLEAAGYGTEVITEMIQAARDWERAADRAANAPVISQKQLDSMASFSTMIKDLGTNIKVGLIDEFHQLSSGANSFTESNREVLDALELVGRFSLSFLVASFKSVIQIVDAVVTSISMFVDAGKIGFNELGKVWNESRIGFLNLQNVWYSTQDAILSGIEKVLTAASYLPSWLGGDKAAQAQESITSIRAGTQDRLDEIEQARQAIEAESAALDERTRNVRQDIYDRGTDFQARLQNRSDEVVTRFNRDIARTYGTPEEQQRYDDVIRSFESGGSRDINRTEQRPPAGIAQQAARTVTQYNTWHITANENLESALRDAEASQLRQVYELTG